jgi:phosphonate transport system ATP-binding protein
VTGPVRTTGAPAASPSVAVDGLSVTYGDGRVALHDVSLRVHPGERVALVGPSGAGKSTLLGVCNGTVPPSAGRVTVLGADPSALRGARLRHLRARVATVHQQLHLVGQLRVVHNVNAGRLGQWPPLRSLWSLVRPQGVAEAREALARVGLADRLYDRTDTLSGGQQQRVALARVLVQRPDLVLADEPVSALDPARAREVAALLGALAGEGCAVLTSMHDLALARVSCDRLVGLRDGRLVFDRPPDAVDDEVAAALFAGHASTTGHP